MLSFPMFSFSPLKIDSSEKKTQNKNNVLLQRMVPLKYPQFANLEMSTELQCSILDT